MRIMGIFIRKIMGEEDIIIEDIIVEVDIIIIIIIIIVIIIIIIITVILMIMIMEVGEKILIDFFIFLIYRNYFYVNE
jgi:hypothetical protein